MADDISNALVPVLLLLPFVDLVMAVILFRLATRPPYNRVLVERAFQAVIVAGVMAGFAAIFINTQLGFTLFQNDEARALGRILTLVLGFAPIAWVFIYLRTGEP